jgi:hypothetical protein
MSEVISHEPEIRKGFDARKNGAVEAGHRLQKLLVRGLRNGVFTAQDTKCHCYFRGSCEARAKTRASMREVSAGARLRFQRWGSEKGAYT